MEIDEVEVFLPTDARLRSRTTAPFLKGPIPLSAVALAARLPGKALAVFVAIHHRAALTGKETVTLPKSLLQDLGVSRDAKARCLRMLEHASLVSVARNKGKAATVTLLSKARFPG